MKHILIIYIHTSLIIQLDTKQMRYKHNKLLYKQGSLSFKQKTKATLYSIILVSGVRRGEEKPFTPLEI